MTSPVTRGHGIAITQSRIETILLYVYYVVRWRGGECFWYVLPHVLMHLSEAPLERSEMYDCAARARSARGGSYESQSSPFSQEIEYTLCLGAFERRAGGVGTEWRYLV